LSPELTAEELRAETEHVAGRDLMATISLLRAGGVLHAEFHDNGRIKVLTLGPEASPPQTEDGEADSAPVNPLKEAARRLAFGMPRKHE
jgi:hypothetical protein